MLRSVEERKVLKFFLILMSIMVFCTILGFLISEDIIDIIKVSSDDEDIKTVLKINEDD